MNIHKNYQLLVLVMKGLAVFIAAAIVDTIYSDFSEGSSISLPSPLSYVATPPSTLIKKAN